MDEPTLVNKLEIRHAGGYHDGYATIALIDGKKFPEQDPPRYERVIHLVTAAYEPILVTVEFKGGTTETFSPKEFSMHLGDLVVETAPHRNPCEITVGGYSVNVKSLSVKFSEGEAVWVDMRFLPRDKE